MQHIRWALTLIEWVYKVMFDVLLRIHSSTRGCGVQVQRASVQFVNPQYHQGVNPSSL